jgi:diacylglycerol O-acyltransferase / wax synthase
MPRQDEPDRLSADDARILGLVSAAITGHTLKLNVLEPGGGPLDVDALRAAVEKRLPSQPRATQRVDTSGPEPRWIQAADFDIRDHVRRQTTSCVSRADMWRIVSGLMSEHLDRSRPLWTFDVIGPLTDGREAVAVRFHHAMCDGIAGVRFLDAVLWDVHPEVQATVAPLSEVKSIGASRPVRATVNDVLLAVITGGLRTWLGEHETLTHHLHAQVPVSLREAA